MAKATQKVEVKADPETPKPSKRKAADPEPTPTPKKKARKEPTPAPVVTSVTKDGRASLPVDVAVEGDSKQAKSLKDGTNNLTLKLDSIMSFSVERTVVFTEGEFEGKQAIILTPAKAFPWKKLVEDVSNEAFQEVRGQKYFVDRKAIRNRIYEMYFAEGGIIGNPIVLDGRRPNKDIYAKSYAKEQKNRVALLAVNKQINQEATPFLYEQCLKFENTTALDDWLSDSKDTVIARLRNVEIKTWVKTSSRNALRNLCPAVNLTRLHIGAGIASSGTPDKAATEFLKDASKFLESVSAKKGEKGAGVGVLGFGRMAFTSKASGSDKAQSWPEAQRVEFLKLLREKMR